MSNVQRPVGGSVPDFAHIGGAGLEVWYAANCVDQFALVTGAPVANTMYAMPFIAPKRGGTIDRLGYVITSSVVGSTKIGLYTATSDSNIYPSALLVDSGTIANSAAVKTATVSVTLSPGKLYWVAIVSDVASTLRNLGVANTSSLLGCNNTFGAALNCGISVAFAFASLPTTFTAGGAFITASPIPALYIRFSA